MSHDRRATGCRLDVKVVPGASRDEIAGWLGDALKIRVSAPPEKGRANAAVIRLLSAALAVPDSDIAIVSGAASPRKVFAIAGLDAGAVRALLSAGRT